MSNIGRTPSSDSLNSTKSTRIDGKNDVQDDGKLGASVIKRRVSPIKKSPPKTGSKATIPLKKSPSQVFKPKPANNGPTKTGATKLPKGKNKSNESLTPSKKSSSEQIVMDGKKVSNSGQSMKTSDSKPSDVKSKPSGKESVKQSTKPAARSPAAELGTGPEIPLNIGGSEPGSSPPKKVRTFDNFSQPTKNPYFYVTNDPDGAMKAEELVNSVSRDIDLGHLFRNPTTVPSLYRKMKKDRHEIRKMSALANEKIVPVTKERNELQQDVEALIMFASQEREYENVLAMYNRSINQSASSQSKDQSVKKNVTFKSTLKFVNDANEEIEYDPSLADSAIAYLEEKLAKKMIETSSLSKLRKTLNEKERTLQINLRTIRQWARTNGIKYKDREEKDE